MEKDAYADEWCIHQGFGSVKFFKKYVSIAKFLQH